MGAGTEAISAPRSVALRQPAYGQESDDPKLDGQEESAREEPAGNDGLSDDGVVRLAHVPIILGVAFVQVSWLAVLAYAAHRFALGGF